MTALILLGVGAHDLGAALASRRRTLVGAVAALTAVVAGAALAVGLTGRALDTGAVGLILAALGATALWVLGRRVSPLTSPLLVAGVGVVAAAEATLAPAGQRFAPAALVLLAAGLALVETANLVTRDVLALAGRWTERAAGAPVDAAPASRTSGDEAGSELRGGRYIGPMERLLMAALGLAAAFPVIAAVMAAKGIVRFPEISQDDGDGSRAEEFLVGSLTSWGLAAAAAFLAHAALHPW